MTGVQTCALPISWGARIAGGDWVGGPQLFVLPPLYPYLLGLVYTVFGRSPSLIVGLQSVLGIICSGLLWRFASRRFGGVAGLCAGILFACTGTVLFFESMLVGTSLAVFLCVALLTCLDNWTTNEDQRSLALAGLSVGLLSVLRPNAIFLIPAVGAIALWPVHTVDRRRFWEAAARYALPLALPLLILFLRNGIVAGEWTPLSGHGGINFYMGDHAGAPGWFAPPPGMNAQITPDEPEGNRTGPRRIAEADTRRTMSDHEVSDYWFERGLAFIAAQPAEALTVTMRKARLFLSAYETPLNYSYEYHRKYAAVLSIPFGQLWVLYPLSILGIWAGFAGEQKRVYDLLILLGVYAASVILFHVSTRYRMPVLPILGLLAGLGLQHLGEALRQKDRRTLVQAGLSAILLITLFYSERGTWRSARPDSMDPFNLGTSHLYAGRPDLAIPYLEEARDAGGQFASLHYNLGVSYASRGRNREAVLAYEKAISVDPGLAPAHTNLGNLLFSAGQYDEAETAYHAALRADAASHNARAALGWVHYTYHRNDSARAVWTAVLSQVPDNASALAGMQKLLDSP